MTSTTSTTSTTSAASATSVTAILFHRDGDPGLQDSVESLVAQTHDDLRCEILVSAQDMQGSAQGHRLLALYPELSIQVVTHGHDQDVLALDAAIRRARTDLVLPLAGGQILEASALTTLLAAFENDPALSVAFSEPDRRPTGNLPGAALGLDRSQLDRPELAQLLQKPREFECALYSREALLSVGGFPRDLDLGYATWLTWIRLLSEGHVFRCLHRPVFADVFGVEAHATWTLGLDPEQPLDLGQWAQVLLASAGHAQEARIGTAQRVLAELPDLGTQTRALVVQALTEDRWTEAALPHAELLLQEGGPALAPGAQAWLSHVRGVGLLACGHRKQAKQAFLNAVAIHPGDALSHARLAQIAGADGDRGRALRHAEDALELEPQQESWRQLVDVLVPRDDRRPYIVFYPGRENTHGRYAMWPVFELAQQRPEYDCTLLFRDERHGLGGEGFALAHARMNRRPDVLVVFRSWWGEELQVAKAAKAHGIPVVMVNHGAMFVRNDDQDYKESLYPADVNCVWGWRDLELWRSWNHRDRFVVTGNPSHDLLHGFEPEPIEGLPERYALFLTPGHGALDFQRKLLFPSAHSLKQHIDVVVKCHPNEPHAEELRRHFRTFTDEAHLLFTLIYRSELVISNVSSALMAALRFGKPIFIHSYEEEGFHVGDFKRKYAGVFNFKSDPEWSAEEVQNAVRPSLEHYEHFAGKPDGRNAERVLRVIEEYMMRSSAERLKPVALPHPEAMAWA